MLVYINNITIFSLTFEDHVNHLNQVFQAIQKSGLMLTVTKYHFGYQLVFTCEAHISLPIRGGKPWVYPC